MTTSAGEVGRAIVDGTGHMREQAEAAAEMLSSGGEKAAAAWASSFEAASAAFALRLDAASRQMTTMLTPLADKLGRLDGALTGLDAQLGKQAAAFSDVTRAAQATTQALSGAAGDMRRAGEPVSAAAARMEATAGQLGDVGQALDRCRGTIELALEGSTRLAETLRISADSLAGRFEGVDRELEQVFRAFEQGAQVYRESYRMFAVDLDKHLESAARTLGGGVEGLSSSIEDLNETLSKARGRPSPNGLSATPR